MSGTLLNFEQYAVAQDTTGPQKYSTQFQLDQLKNNFKLMEANRRGLMGTYPKLAFSDDFNTQNIADADTYNSTTKWYSPGHSTYGWAQFLTVSAMPSAFQVADGQLRLRLQQINGRWYGATIATTNAKAQGFTITKGYIEVRMKVAQQTGGWSAFWLTSLDSPTTGMHTEIDAVESYGGAAYGYNSAIHLWPSAHPPAGASQVHWAIGVYPKAPIAADGQFHTYGCELTDDWIIFYRDDVESSRVARAAEWNDAPFRIMLSLAGGPDTYKSKAVSPVDMFIDSVNVWTE